MIRVKSNAYTGRDINRFQPSSPAKSLLITACGVLAISSDGLPQRLSEGAILLSPPAFDTARVQKQGPFRYLCDPQSV